MNGKTKCNSTVIAQNVCKVNQGATWMGISLQMNQARCFNIYLVECSIDCKSEGVTVIPIDLFN